MSYFGIPIRNGLPIGLGSVAPLASGGGSPFSPLSLFSGGAPGAWYDPSDYTTLFQDSAGTTPVTAVEQPVGLMLDKSQGLALGSEVITPEANRDFSSDTGYWSKEGGATISGGVVNVNTAVDNYPIYRFNTAPAGYFELTYTITLVTGGLRVVTGASSGTQRTASGTYTERLYNPALGTLGFRTFGPCIGTIDNVSMKAVSGNHAFQATSASRPVLKIDGNGKLYLKFDGVDDSLSTNSISFTSTDKMSVFAGVRKLSDAATGRVAEISVNAAVNAGAFAITAPEGAASNYGFFLRGDTAYPGYGATTFAAPITNVLSVAYDISGSAIGDEIKPRINSTIPTLSVISAGPAGGGNFGNYPLFIGRRNNASLPFNGQMYSMIIVGKAVTAGELSSTETYVNQKTGAY